ncbi:FAD-dependent monooxygenase [Rhodococcus opacus]|nr:FAD-dependent monooxygenase [Rhodococcus opacus]
MLIVGGGPVGLSLAGDLGWRGIDTVLVEARDGSVFQPKMDMVGIRTMEFCRRWGIVDDVESAGYNRAQVQDCAWVTNLNGFEFGREAFAAPQDEPSPAQSPQHRERCPQNFFDPVLTRFANGTGHADIRYRTRLLSFVDHGDHVTATVEARETGEVYDIDADYLVGTDGGDSTVRTALGIAMSGDGALTYTSNAIIRCAGLPSLHTTSPAYRYIFIGPEGTWATLVAIDGRHQWRFSLIGDGTQREVSEEEMRAAIVRAVGREFDFEILSMLPWVRRQLVADNYRKGRVFIAGDAAHLTSPTGVRYEHRDPRRRQSVVETGRSTAGLGRRGAARQLRTRTASGRGPQHHRGRRQPEKNARTASDDARPEDLRARRHPGDTGGAKAFGDHYTEMMKREWHSIGIHLGYVYDGSPVIVPDGTPLPAMQVSSYAPSARPGSRAPHVWLDPARSILDEFGPGFVLLRFDPSADSAPLQAAAERAGVPLRIVDIDDPVASELYVRALVLVRPDGQVSWRGDTIVEDPEALLTRVSGRRERALVLQ